MYYTLAQTIFWLNADGFPKRAQNCEKCPPWLKIVKTIQITHQLRRFKIPTTPPSCGSKKLSTGMGLKSPTTACTLRKKTGMMQNFICQTTLRELLTTLLTCILQCRSLKRFPDGPPSIQSQRVAVSSHSKGRSSLFGSRFSTTWEL